MGEGEIGHMTISGGTMVLSAMPVEPKFCVIISPCSVTRKRPLIVPGGWANTARYTAGREEGVIVSDASDVRDRDVIKSQ